MKRFAVLLFCAAAGWAGSLFSTGQAARALIGQESFTKQDAISSDKIVGGVSGIAYAKGILVVADSNQVGALPDNNRVLVYTNPLGAIADPTAAVPQNGTRCPVCVGQAAVVLGQPDFAKSDPGLSRTGLRRPTGVATDGQIIVVADTDNNRVLIWRSIPTANNAPADIVLGQPDFTSNTANNGSGDPRITSAKSLKGPRGVWIQGTRLFVADVLNNRVLIWRNIPTSNFQEADVVVGQPSFVSTIQPDVVLPDPSQTNMLNPVGVSSDGQHMFVADLGHNRVLIYRSIPDTNGAAADVEIGQPDWTDSTANYSFKLDQYETGKYRQDPVLCTVSTGVDGNNNPLYPARCDKTLSFPRMALSDGTRLFVADGGNDRILVYNTIPTANAAPADFVIGQRAFEAQQNSDVADPLLRASTDSIRTPLGIAWDGVNLYSTDPFNRRILVFSPGSYSLPLDGVRNAASSEVFAMDSLTVAGAITSGNSVTVELKNTQNSGIDNKYTYTIPSTADTLAKVASGIAGAINSGNSGAGDPQVIAGSVPGQPIVILTARLSGAAGNNISVTVTTSDAATIQVTSASSTFSGGNEAAHIAPGTLVSLMGGASSHLAASTESAPDLDHVPTNMGGSEVYFDGVKAPLLYVSPSQINAQFRYDIDLPGTPDYSQTTATNSSNVSAYVRTVFPDGRVQVTRAVAVPVVPANPGIFGYPGSTEPRPGVVLHGSSQATGTIQFSASTLKAGDAVTVTVEDRAYSYTAQAGDTLSTVLASLVSQINSKDPKVYAFPSGTFDYLRLRARIAGKSGNGIRFNASTPTGSGITVSPLSTTMCCANVAYAAVTPDNPAIPGENLIFYATGVGMQKGDAAKYQITGQPYAGPFPSDPERFPYTMAGGKTAQTLVMAPVPGQLGLYEVDVELNSDLPTTKYTQLHTAQDTYRSNVVSFPVYNAAQPISDITYANLTTTGVTITWTTAANATSTFQYGTTTSYGGSATDSGSGTTSHKVVLTGLTCGTTYHFVINSVSGGTASTSGDKVFTTSSCS